MDRSTLRQMLNDIKFWRLSGWKLYENDQDITESWLSDKTRRARHLWRVVTAREHRDA